MTDQPSLSSNKNTSTPKISVVVCTRNRGNSVVPTLETIFSNVLPADEVILIDQSTNQETQEAIAPFLVKPGFKYHRSTQVGTGRARNDGIVRSKGAYILFTDDDCTVPPDWIEGIVRIFDQYPQVGAVYSSVASAPCDNSIGAIPAHEYKTSKLMKSIPQYYKSVGMGAGMSIRREATHKMGMFDETLGPGATFFSGEDHDYALRTLVNGWYVYEAAEMTVVHFGFRTYDQFRELTRRDWMALGAVHAKFIKCSHWGVWLLTLYNLLVHSILNPVLMIFQLKRPQGFKRFMFYWQGFYKGWKTPVDCKKILYQFPGEKV